MTRSLKTLGLALVAVLALTAIAASSASAFTTFEAPEAGTEAFKGTQSGTATFNTVNGSITCTGGTFRGMTTTGAHPEIATSDSNATSGAEVGTKGIEYSGCKFLGIIGVTVHNNSCQYNFHAATGVVDIVPSTGECATEGITFEAAGCKTHVRSQTGLSGVTYTNTGSGTTGRTVTVTPNVSGITYQADTGCPTPTISHTGTYTGSTVAVGGTTNTNTGMAARAVIIV
jgi:hypothetical protein